MADVWDYQINTVQALIDDLESRIPIAEPFTRMALEAQLAGQKKGLAWIKARAELYRGEE